MDAHDALKRILESLHEAMLDDACWPAASALIDEACGMKGSGLLVAKATCEHVQLCPLGIHYRGEARNDLEREYLEDYHPDDERVPRFRRLADGHLVQVADLYTDHELKTSRTYNEMLRRADVRNGLNVRLQVPDGSHIAWCIANPVDSDGWISSRITMITALLPHLRHFIRVRQALVRAEARNTTSAKLLENPRIGVIHLDRRGRVLEANDLARRILRHGDGLSDRDGILSARAPADQRRFEQLLAAALPDSDTPPAAGSLLLRRSPVVPPFVVHVKPVSAPEPDYAAWQVAALVLIVEPGRQHRVDPEVVASTLGLTPTETKVAVWLAEGKNVRDMVEETGHTEGTIYWHLNKIYKKQSISGQVDLVRLLLSLAELGY